MQTFTSTPASVPTAPVRVWLLRHAETEYNAAGNRIGGRSPLLPLSTCGLQQAASCGRQMARDGMTFDRIFCSTAYRTRQTISIIRDVYPEICPVETEYTDTLLELSMGAWEGRLRSDIYTPERLAEINSNNWLFQAPGGESQRDVELRLMHFLDERIAAAFTSGRFLIVGHGCSFKCLLRGILDSDPAETYKMKIANCQLLELHLIHHKWQYINPEA